MIIRDSMRTKIYLAALLICCKLSGLQAQEYNPLLKKYADSLRYCKIETLKYQYNDSFKALLKTILDDENSFNYNLDSIKQTISVLESIDKKVKCITWVMTNEREEFTNFGVVLYKRKASAETKVFWLRDYIFNKADSVYEDFPADNWPGALYYQMYQFKWKKKDAYCVVGFNGKSSFMNRKIIDVLWFDKEDELHIGAPVFYQSETDYTPRYRMFFDHADQTTMVLRFEPTKKIITFSNLVPSNPQMIGQRQYYIPDGRIDYFALTKKGKWIKHEGLTEFDMIGQ